MIKGNSGQPDITIQQLFEQKKNAVRRAVDKANRDSWNSDQIQERNASDRQD